jgi:GNAT superfamily N-acetyltransferase
MGRSGVEANETLNSNLAQIRLLEAVSFRSFPATTTQYDGTWAIRLTAGHPAKRLNSVNPLDPNDELDLENRIRLAQRRFESFGRPFVFRLTPLAPVMLCEMLVQWGWSRHEESIVMKLDIRQLALEEVRDQVPLKDIGLWVDSYISLSEEDRGLKPGLVEVISATEPETGLFLHAAADNSDPESVVRCVCDRTMAGLFDLVTAQKYRGKGHARALLLSALLWARRNGANTAWLQVVANNTAATSLYRSIGFEEVYRYNYWKPDATPETRRG